jgi:predicted dehydrogenase
VNQRSSGSVIVGAGLMGRWHAHAIRAAGRSITAIVDHDPTRASALARRHGARALVDVTEALDADPLAVHICTPPDSHRELARIALGRRAHVMIEKPFASSIADVRAILSDASMVGRYACPVHQFVFQRGVRNAIAELPRLGPTLHADFVACSAGAEISGQRQRLVIDILPHPLSLLRVFAGAPVATARYEVLTLAQGEVRIVGACGRMSFGILISSAGRPTRNTARLIGAGGSVHLDLFHGFATFETPRNTRMGKMTRPFRRGGATLAAAGANLAIRVLRRQPAYPGLQELVTAFYATAERGASPPITAEETLDVAEAVDRLAPVIMRS